MGRIEKTVFISYRRTTVPWALLISKVLTHDGYDVFFDYTGIPSGDFARSILENIGARAHFLVLLAPSTLERINEPGDWLRREIEYAMQERRNIVPLFLEGFDLGAPAVANQMTGRLADLRKYNGLGVPAEYFDAAMDKLRQQFLNRPLDAVLHPASERAIEVASKQQVAAHAAVVERHELTASAWFERGCAAVDHDEEIRCFTEAIRLKPDYAEAYYNRGIARGDKGDLEGAVKDYAEAIRINPDHAEAYYNRGSVRESKGDLEGAIRDYGEAIRLQPDDADAYYNRGSAREGEGDLDGAIKDYDEAIRLKPDDADAYYNRGSARESKGDLEGAIEDYDEAIRLKPDDADAYNNRGSVRESKGDLEGAIEDYDKAICLRPGDGEAYYNRALVLERRGDNRAAAADLQRYLGLGGGQRDGDQAEVEMRIRSLKER